MKKQTQPAATIGHDLAAIATPDTTAEAAPASPAPPKKRGQRKPRADKNAPATGQEDAKATPKKSESVEQLVAREVGLMKAELQKIVETVSQANQPKTPLIFSAVRKVMALIGPIAKSEHHPEGFDFRRIDQLCARLQPFLVDCGVFYVPEVLEEKEVERPVVLDNGSSFVNIFTKVKVRWHIYAVDGSTLPNPCVTMGEGVSEQHFSTNAAITMAEKAMLVKVFCIPIFGAEDPEAADPELSTSSRPAVTHTVTAPAGDVVQPDLFGEAETEHPAPAATKRRRKAQEPQTSVAGGAVEALDQTAAPVSVPLTAGFISILQSQLKNKGLAEETLFDHFKVKGFDEIMQGQMGEATAFIQGA